jgi:hypothetical protein
MQSHDFGAVQDNHSFTSIPAGEYRCRICEVRVGLTKEGSERWALRLEVAGGDLAGRTAAWDGLVWSERGLPRVKYVLARLGFDVSGRLALEAYDLVGREVTATLQEEERDDPLSGQRVVRLRVPYYGYGPLANGARHVPAPESDPAPF